MSQAARRVPEAAAPLATGLCRRRVGRYDVGYGPNGRFQGLPVMQERERRDGAGRAPRALEKELSFDQVVTLRELERFGWELKFVRRPPFQPPIPVVFDPDRKHYAVIKQDGSLDEAESLNIR